MFDPKRMLEDFLGGGQGSGLGGGQGGGQGGGSGYGKAGTFAAGAATSGLVGLLLGSKKAKKIGGNLLGYGGAAVLGGLAFKAWQNYQAKQQGGSVPAAPYRGSVPNTGGSYPQAEPIALPLPADSPFDPSVGTAADGKPFALALVRAMIAASKADGHIDAKEQTQLFERIEHLQLDADAKAFVFDELGRPTNLDAIAALPRGQEQAAEIWLASRLAIDPDDVREKAYMSALAAKLRLPPELLNQLEAQAAAATVESEPA